MSAIRSLALGIVSLSVLAAVAAADELVLTDHHIVDGEVLSSDESSVTLRHELGDKTVETVFPVDHIEPYSFYVVRDRAVGKDAKARLALAEFCLEHELYPRARKQFEQAARLDPSLKEDADAGIASARDGSAKQLMSKAADEQSAGKVDAAMRTLSETVRYYGDTKVADQAREQVDDLHQQVLAQRAAERAAKVQAATDKELKKIQKELDKAATSNKTGLQAKQQSQMKQGFDKSLAEYRRAIHQLEELAKKYKDDPAVVETVQGEIAQANSDMIEVHMNLGAVYVTRSSYQQALGEANRALAIDPKSSRALSFRNRVEACSSRGIGIL